MPKIFTDQDKEVIRLKLLEAGRNALETRSCRGISLDDITASVGIAKGTFYNFFPSKEQFFYAVMQQIKEDNRVELRELVQTSPLSKADVERCLYHRYTHTKTVYDYFSTEDMRRILRKLPEGDSANDSVEFAELLCGQIAGLSNSARPDVIVNLCNVLALTASHRAMFEPDAYDETIHVLCRALTNYIFGGDA